MAPPQTAKPAAAAASGSRKSDRLGGAILPTDKAEALSGQLIDKHGHLHSESVLTAWSPAMLRIMGIRRVEAEGGAA